MKKIILGIVTVMMVSLFLVTVKAEDITISDFVWDTNGTENDPTDDKISFTAPTAYRDLTYNAKYDYIITNNDKKSYVNNYNAAIDDNGKVTINFKRMPFYGIGLDYKITVQLIDKSEAVLAKSSSVSQKFTITKLDKPTDMFLGAEIVSYEHPFGALNYEISHYDATGTTLKEPVIKTDKESYRLTVPVQVGDIVRVVAINGEMRSETAEIISDKVITINDAAVNIGADNDHSKDTITFTAPEGYRDFAANLANYSLNVNGKFYGLYNTQYSSNISIDDKGLATIDLSKVYCTNCEQSNTVNVVLYNSSYSEICSSNTLTYALDKLGKPAPVSVSDTKVSFNRVFGATKYQISHFDKNNQEVEKSFIVTSIYNVNLTVAPEPGDVIKVTAMNDTLTSDAAECVIADTAIKDLTWNDNVVADPKDDTLTFQTPTGYSDLTSSTYSYSITINGVPTAIKDTRYYSVDDKGVVTINLSKFWYYGKSFDYDIDVSLKDSTGKVLSKKNIKKSFNYTSLDTPTTLHLIDGRVTYDLVFGASKYKISHLDKDNNEVETPIESNTNYTDLKQPTSNGDTITVEAENDKYTSKPAVYTCIVISDITWNDQGTTDPWDDTLTFTAPMNYLKPSDSNKGAYHYTCKINGANAVYLSIDNDFKIDQTTGKTTVILKNVYGYGAAYSYNIQLRLDDKIGYPLATFNTASYTFPTGTSLDKPTIKSVSITDTSTTIGCRRVFGAEYYHLLHYDKKGNLVENMVDSRSNYISLKKEVSDGDVVEVYADNQKLESEKDRYTIKIAVITDLKWNDQNTDDPIDDILTFTMPEGYRDFNSDKYDCSFTLDGKYGEFFMDGYNYSMNPDTGLVTVYLANASYYGGSLKYSPQIWIYNKENNVSQSIAKCNAASKTFEITSLQKPQNLFVGSTKVTFDKSFDATSYEISHYDNTGKTLVEPVIKTKYTTATLTQEPKNGETIRVVALNDTMKSEAAEYTISKSLQMNYLVWDTNDTDWGYDDTLKFTAPEGYQSLEDTAKYYYELHFVLPNGDEVKLQLNKNGVENPAVLDEKTGEVTVSLYKKWWFGSYTDYDCYIALVAADTHNVISQTPHAKHSYKVTTLNAPKDLQLNGGSIQFNLVYGATKYEVTHYDSKGNVKEGPMEATWDYTVGKAALKDISEGDTVKVVAERPEDAAVTSTQSVYTVTNLISVTNISLDHTSLVIDGKNSAQLTATIAPQDATNKEINWKSSDTSVAVVDETGKVTGVNPGTAVISAVTNDGGHKAVCNVNILLNGEDVSKIKPFVSTLYSVTLGRTPDQDGLNYWLGQLSTGKQTGTQIVDSFVFGKEFTAKSYCNEHFLTHVYEAVLGRKVDSEDLKYWEDKMAKGMTREEVLNGFLGGKEFKAICDAAGITVGEMPKLPAKGTIQTWTCPEDGKMDNQIGSFVLRMYTKCLNRKAEKDGTVYWINKLRNNEAGGTAVAHTFFFGKEFEGLELDNTEYVKRIYLTFFDREGDEAGMKYWVDRLEKGASRESVFLGFANSTEWSKICTTYGIKK